MSDPARILLVRLSHLGDVVHALPVLHALRRRYPAAELGWVVQPEFDGLLEGLPGLARRFHFGRRAGAGAWPRLSAELTRFAPELVVDAQGNAKSALCALVSGAPRRLGLARADWREPFAAHVLTETAPPLDAPQPAHAMQRMAQLARHVGGDGPLRRDAGLSAGERARGEEELSRRLGGDERPVLLALSTPGDLRSWPTERWVELARSLGRAGRSVLVLSGPAERALGEEVARELAGEGPSRVAHWVGQRGLRELAALFEAAARREGRLVACDSGPLHLAAASGLPVLALAGPQDPRRTGPWPLPGPGSPHAVVRAADPPPCMPCLARRCAHPLGKVCMERIGVDGVLAALEEAVDSSAPSLAGMEDGSATERLSG